MPSYNQQLLSGLRELPGGLHLWADSVDRPTDLAEGLETLSDDERARAGRFHFAQDRLHFVARRAFVRSILAGYVGVAPAGITMRTSRHGRPELDPPCGIFFNASHSEGLAIVAVARDRLVGVDIERVRPIADALEVAERFFSRNEVDLLRSTPEESRAEAFLTIWTRKESYVKAVGVGLSIPFDAFDVSIRDDGRTGRPRGPRGDTRFAFSSLDGLDGYVGAVTAAGTGIVTTDEVRVAMVS